MNSTQEGRPGSVQQPEGARRQLALIAGVQVLGLAVWFSATAIAPTLRVEWGLSTGAAVWLTASVQLGFATGAVLSGLLTLLG